MHRRANQSHEARPLHSTFVMSAKTRIKSHPSRIDGNHLIGEFADDARGPTLIIVGGLHGNEPAGLLALSEIAQELEGRDVKLRGRVYLLAGNSRALRTGVRFIDADLNRHWTIENIAKARANTACGISESLEQREMLEMFDEILKTARDEVYAVDLHSTSANGRPFATVGDTMRNRRFALMFPATILLGIEEQLEGTLLEYLNNAGVVTLGFEGGQHESASTVRNHRSLAWLSLINSGILNEEDVPDLMNHESQLAEASGGMRILEVRHREAIHPSDNFEMAPGFRNFDPVRQGETLAKNNRGAIRAGESGLILMPLYQKLGEDGFFIGREISPFWLWLSAVLRKLRTARLVRILPGVWRDPADPESLIINTRVARFFPLQIFHLLGFRKRRWRNNQLVVSRRRHDCDSPFKLKRRNRHG
jgi:predicted deacylase